MKSKAMTSLSTGKKALIFIACLVVPTLVGFSSSLLAGDVKAKYNAMAQPPLAPPDWIFGVMWTVLYLLMGIALFLVITAAGSVGSKLPAFALFVAQLLVNYAWSPIFFRGSLWVALVIILLLDLLVLATVGTFWRVRKLAGILMVPYMLWILFATYLNVAFAIIN